jgi:hypothetical protein
VVDSQDADDASVVIDLVDHAVWAPTGSPQAGQLTL